MKLRKRGGQQEHINFVLPSELKRQLEAHADERIVSVSHVLRQLVRAYLKNAAAEQAVTGGSR